MIGSWIIRSKADGEAIMETFNKKLVDRLKTEKYEAVPAKQHLVELNKKYKLAYHVARRSNA